MLAEQELDYRGAATAKIMFDIQEMKRTRGIFGTLNKLATSAEGRENHFMPNFMENILGFWTKISQQKQPKNVLHGVGFF